MKILFVAGQRAACAWMAEAVARARHAPNVEAACAAAQPSEADADTVAVLAEAGIESADLKARSVVAAATREYDVVITMSREAAATCPTFAGLPIRVDWNLPEPAAPAHGEPARQALRLARDAVRRLVDDLFDRGYLRALAESRRCEHLILSNVSDGIIAHDMNRRIFFFNEGATRITGYRRAEALNRDCHEVFPGHFCGGRCAFCDPQSPNPSARREELDIATKGGEKRRVHLVMRPLRDDAGQQVGVLLSFHDLTREHYLARRAREVSCFSGIIGRDEKMLEVFDLIRDLADTNVPVLVQGESGTGKELVAAAIHNEGQRANKLFVPVNCGALPEALLESELFGHVRGAFTGAIRDKMGRFELADGGTIFLDEIGDISPAVQVKLLRVLQEGRFERVGSEKTLRVDVRIISATHKDLSAEIAAGRFREDLFYRLSVVPLWLPPLRERRGDIPLLADDVLKRTAAAMHKEGVSLSPDALDALMDYDWPGNVRELQNWILFALVKCKSSTIQPAHLPPPRRATGPILRLPVRPPSAAPPPEDDRPLRRKVDGCAAREAIAECQGNKVKAARLLGISRATLYRLLGDGALTAAHGERPKDSSAQPE